MGNAATIQSRERKSRQRFHLEIVSDDVGHLREQQEAVICAIQTKVMAGRWRNQILSKASSRLPSRLPKTRSVAKPAVSPGTDHDSRDVEVYTGGNRVFRGSRLKALTKLGDYVLKRKLGEGSFAQVRLATHNLTGESVAVKLFDKTKKLSEYELKHFYREATVLQRVQSKHAAAAFQFLDAEFVYALVFELIETDLLDDVTKSGPYNEDKARITIRQVISGIEAVHAVDLVHRDLKLENIGVTKEGVVKLLDFGLAGDIRGKDMLETQCGTMMYSAPELLGDGPYGKQVDIWSIGVVLYSLLYARLPYDDGTRRNRDLTQLHAMMLDHEYVCCTTLVALPASRDSIPRESRWPVGVLTRILTRRYALPDGSPESLKQVFRGLLEVRPHRRVTCEELWANPWIKNERDGHPSLAPITLLATSTAITDDTIDMEIVESVAKQTGLAVPTCVQSVIRNRCDPVCGAYHTRARHKQSVSDGTAIALPLVEVEASPKKGIQRKSRISSLCKVFQRTSSDKSKDTKESKASSKLRGRKKGGNNAEKKLSTTVHMPAGLPAIDAGSKGGKRRHSPPGRGIRRKQVRPEA
eukprot:m.259017 g.259017  ORF g.259017 m.259017 type:complete len:583 (-) comp26632_c1_seq1:1501-3249(-)